ncbi:MAG: hypothetical protein AAFO82_16550, partial [Bacteroidota bacterium]
MTQAIHKKQDWSDLSKKHLFAALEQIRVELEAYKKRKKANSQPQASKDEVLQLKEENKTLYQYTALARLIEQLGLSKFEEKILLLCAGVELKSSFSELIKDLQGDSKSIYPTFYLALAAFEKEKHLDAIAPNASLRDWELLQIKKNSLLGNSPISIDEHILYYLLGTKTIHHELYSLVNQVPFKTSLTPSHESIAFSIADLLTKFKDTSQYSYIQLVGQDTTDVLSIIAAIAKGIEYQLYQIAPYAIPNNIKERTHLAKLWEREARLKQYFLVIDCSDLNEGDKNTLQNILHFVSSVRLVFLINFPE